MLAGGAFAPPAPDKLLVPYVRDFWSVTYPADREAQGRPISRAYTANNLSKIKNYVEAYAPFKSLALDGLTVDEIERWRTWLARSQTARGVNICLQSVKVPLSEALRRGLVKANPFTAVKNSRETRAEKGVLTEAEARALVGLLDAPADDPRPLAASLLALGCGLRRGEVRGLHWADIDNGLIHVTHNYTDADGAKTPKCGSEGVVPVPGYVAEALARVPRLANSPLVFPSPTDPARPVAGRMFELWFYATMTAIGIDAEARKARRLTLHGMRHSFITLLQMAGVSVMEAAALARKRDVTDASRRYTHGAQVTDLDMARERRMNALGAGLMLGALAAARQGGRA